MKNILFLLLLSYYTSHALDFKVASYNVENLFDLKDNGSEYKEFKSNSKYWNKKAFEIKLNNIVKVIKDLDADILALQEVENKNTFNILKKKTKIYKYSYFLKKRSSAIGLGIFSKLPIIKNKKIVVNRYNNHTRPILKSTIKINDKKLIIYINHWKSKRSAENTRIPYAKALMNDIKKYTKNDDYIILGDLNSNYNEYITFKNNKKLNNTYDITAINQVLNTSLNNNLLHKKDLNIKKIVHYNLWLDINKNNRFSAFYRTKKVTPDNIILSKHLFDNKNIYYIDKSFSVFKTKYLIKNNKINRWNLKKKKGYSDHLPVYALFSTTKKVYNIKKSKNKDFIIDDLYEIQTLNKDIKIKNVFVIYKHKKLAIIKGKNTRAIMIYANTSKLKVNYSYDLIIEKLKDYNGVKEIVKYSIIKQNNKTNNTNIFYLDASKHNILDEKYQNEIVTNLTGTYKNHYLYFNNKRIKLYFQKNIIKPKENKSINITKAHLNNFKTKIQITINKQSDFKAN